MALSDLQQQYQDQQSALGQLTRKVSALEAQLATANQTTTQNIVSSTTTTNTSSGGVSFTSLQTPVVLVNAVTIADALWHTITGVTIPPGTSAAIVVLVGYIGGPGSPYTMVRKSSGYTGYQILGPVTSGVSYANNFGPIDLAGGTSFDYNAEAGGAHGTVSVTITLVGYFG